MAVHAANKPPIEHATRIGKARPYMTVVWSGFLLCFLAQAIPTQIIAAKLSYISWLGKGLLPGVYFPGEFVIWIVRWWQPWALPMHRPILMYPLVFKDAFYSLIWSEPLAFIVAILSSVAIAKATIPNDDLDPIDSGARWFDAVQAKKQGLIDPVVDGLVVEGGMIVGVDPQTGKILRYTGNQGAQYIDPPGNGKTTAITSSLLSRLKIVVKRRFAWQFWVKVRKLTAMQRRAHPWGEEPLLIVTDPKFEYLGWTSGFQHDVLKKRVECIAPLGIPERGIPIVADDGETEVYQPFPKELVAKLARYNPFWSARIGTKDSYQDCLTKARALIDTPNPTGENAFFSQMAEIFGAAVIEHCGFVAINTGNYKLFSVPGMLDYISSFKAETITEANGQKREKPGLEVMLDAMKRYPHDLTGRMGWTMQHSDGSEVPSKTKPSIFNAADQMASLADRTRASVFGAFVNKLAIFQGERIRDYVMDCTFEFDVMADDPERSSTIYIGVDAMNLKEVKGYLRLLQEDAMRVLTRGGTPVVKGRSMRPYKYPWAMIFEEAYASGYNDVVDNSSGFIRGYGGFVWQVWQSYAQFMKTYSDSQHRNVIVETLGVFMYGAAKTVEGGSYIEDELGKHTRRYTVESRSGDAFSMSPLGHVQEQEQTPQAPLISAKEFTQLPKTHFIAIIDGFNYYLRRAQFFLFPELVKRSKMTPKLSGDNTVTEPFFVRCFRDVIGDDGWEDLLVEREARKPEMREISLDDLEPGNDPIVGGSGSFYKIDAGIAQTPERAIQIALDDYCGATADSAA